MDFRTKRWISLFAGLGIEALCGIAYAWSVFQAPLMEKYGWTVTQVALTYSLTSISSMLCTIFFGGKAHHSFKGGRERIEVDVGSQLAVVLEGVGRVKGEGEISFRWEGDFGEVRLVPLILTSK